MRVTFMQAMEARFESHAASAARRAERLQAKVASLEESLRATHRPVNNDDDDDDDDDSAPTATLVPSSTQQPPRASPSPLGGSADVVVSSGTAPLPSPSLSALAPTPSASYSTRLAPTVRAPDSAGDYASRLRQAAMAAMTTAVAPPALPRSSPPPALYTVGDSSSNSTTAATTSPLSRRRTPDAAERSGVDGIVGRHQLTVDGMVGRAPSDLDSDTALANLMAMNERLLRRLGEPAPSAVALRSTSHSITAAWSPLSAGQIDLSSSSTMAKGRVAAAGSALSVNDGARGALAAARAALDAEEAALDADEAARTGSPIVRTAPSPPPWRAPTPGAVAPAVPRGGSGGGGGGGAVRRATNKKVTPTGTRTPSARSPPPGGSRREMMAEITALKQQCADLAEVVGIQTTPTRLYY
jgi:hypothetical protein